MGKIYFTITDIKSFLNKMGYDWDEKIYLGSMCMTPNPDKHFNGMGFQKVRLYSREKDELREVNIAVSNTRFEFCAVQGFYGHNIAGKSIRDLSCEWMKKLFMKNEEGYIEVVQQYYNNLQKTSQNTNMNHTMKRYVLSQIQLIEDALEACVQAGENKDKK